MVEKPPKTIPSTHIVDSRASGVPTGSTFHEPPAPPVKAAKEEIADSNASVGTRSPGLDFVPPGATGHR